MLSDAHFELGENGFDSVRFSEQPPASEASELPSAVPLFMRIPNKSGVSLFDISHLDLSEIVNACAGMEVGIRFNKDAAAAIRVDLATRTVEISGDISAGLRDLIFAAVLLRVHHNEQPIQGCFDYLVDETQLRIMDELPHVIGYSGCGALECSKLAGDRLLLKPQAAAGFCSVPLPYLEKILEQRSISLSVA